MDHTTPNPYWLQDCRPRETCHPLNHKHIMHLTVILMSFIISCVQEIFNSITVRDILIDIHRPKLNMAA